jgi:hypothetical protein
LREGASLTPRVSHQSLILVVRSHWIYAFAMILKFINKQIYYFRRIAVLI